MTGQCEFIDGVRAKHIESLGDLGKKWRRKRVDRMGIICSIYYRDQWNDYWKTAH